MEDIKRVAWSGGKGKSILIGGFLLFIFLTSSGQAGAGVLARHHAGDCGLGGLPRPGPLRMAQGNIKTPKSSTTCTCFVMMFCFPKTTRNSLCYHVEQAFFNSLTDNDFYLLLILLANF